MGSEGWGGHQDVSLLRALVWGPGRMAGHILVVALPPAR
jgi:hypothetical protein